MGELYLLALRATRGTHAEAARNVLLTLLLAQRLAAADHDGPPHASQRAPRSTRARRSAAPPRGSISGRRARG